MRPMEIGGFLLALPLVLVLAGTLPVAVGFLFAVLSCAALAAAGFWIGPHWQMLPLYLAVLLVLVSLPVLGRTRRSVRWAMAGVFGCLLILTAAFTSILPMFQLAQPTGRYVIGTRIVALVDPVRMETHIAGPPRPREIMVQIWYPTGSAEHSLAGFTQATYRRWRETTLLSSYMAVLKTHSLLNAPVAAVGSPFPVLLFNPAWTRQRTQNTYQMEDLASHGFIVVGIDHAYNSGPTAFPDGRVLTIAGIHDIADFHHTTIEQQIAIGNKEVHIEAGDDILALNYLAAQDLNPRSPWFQRVDADNAGAFGHSFGGAVSAQTCYEDARVKGALNEDGWMFGDVSDHGLDKPYMVMSDSTPDPTSAQLNSPDVQVRRESRMDMRDEKNMFRTLHDFGGYLLTIEGATHDNFCDRSLYSPFHRLTNAGSILPRRAHEIVEAYTLQFFSKILRHQPAPLLQETPSPYKEVHFESWSAHAPAH